MRALFAILIATALCAAVVIAADGPTRPTPLIRTVDPPAAKAGTEMVASGDHLGKTVVEALYLTQGEATIQVAITSQTDTAIAFKVPANAKPGRFGLMVLTTGIQPQYLDEPVYLTIE
jgi:hypothetical protein